MQIIMKSLGELMPYENNPRRNDRAVKYVVESIRQFGFRVPIIIDRDGVIVAGHTRHKAAKRLKLQEVPCIVADDLTEEQIKAFRLADNKVSEASIWDADMLVTELGGLGLDMTAFGFEETPVQKREKAKDTLRERFIIAPFSVLDARDGEWQRRKNVWRELIASKEGRADNLLRGGIGELAKESGSTSLSATSEFDPVLCEILINWFCPQHGCILDPFAGGSVRGIVSSYLGAKYTGIDLRQEQIDANEADFERNADLCDIFGQPVAHPRWICGDGLECQTSAPGEYDFLLTCPPYADLEIYSDDERDISNMDYPKFKATFADIIKNATAMLKQDTFAAIVVGEVRDKKGIYRNLVSDTIEAFQKAGLDYYNEMVLITMVGTLAYRVSWGFEPTRKIGKEHQNVLVFVKGDPQNASRIVDGEIFTTKQPTTAHEKVLVFVKGKGKRATSKLEKYSYVF